MYKDLGEKRVLQSRNRSRSHFFLEGAGAAKSKKFFIVLKNKTKPKNSVLFVNITEL